MVQWTVELANFHDYNKNEIMTSSRHHGLLVGCLITTVIVLCKKDSYDHGVGSL